MLSLVGIDLDKTFKEFTRSQEEIYNRSFWNRQLSQLETARLIKEGASGYLIIWQYRSKVSRIIADFCKKIAETYPLLCYDGDSLHTTISDYRVSFGSETKAADENILRDLAQSVEVVLSQIRRPKIDHNGWLFSKDTIIISGYPDIAFLEAALLIQTSAHKLGIELRLPWGGHLTVARFTDIVRNSEKIFQLRELLTQAPCGYDEINPNSIVVGSFVINSRGLVIQVFRRYPLF